MKTEYQYIKFECYDSTKKTTKWYIKNIHSDSILGKIKWFSAWRQYCFFTNSGCIFNDGCMRDILDFIAQLEKERKNFKKGRG